MPWWVSIRSVTGSAGGWGELFVVVVLLGLMYVVASAGWWLMIS